MGDVGALALGAALGAIAIIVRQEIVLFIMGGVFVVETLSVMIQVASFKLTGQARLPHGADPSSLRAEGLEGKPGRGAVLDHHHAAGAVRPFDAEAALTVTIRHRRVVVLGLGADRAFGGALGGASRRARLGGRHARRRRRAPRSSGRSLPQVDARRPDRSPLRRCSDAELIVISPGLRQGSAADSRRGRARRRAGRRHRALRARPAARRRSCWRSPARTARRTVTALTGELLRAAGLTADDASATSASRCSMRCGARAGSRRGPTRS